MAYWVLNEDGQAVAVVAKSDPDIQRILERAQQTPMLAPTLATGMHSQHTATTSRAPAALKPKAAAAKPKPAGVLVFQIRHVPTGRFLTNGLDHKDNKPPKYWATNGHAKNAISHAVRRGLGSLNEFEIVPTSLPPDPRGR